MAIDDPKTRVRPAEPKDEPVTAEPNMAALLTQMAAMQAETARLLLEMKQSGGTQNAAVIETLLAQQEQLLVKTRPENTEHPGISAYSYPEGERARPKPDLKCQFIWCGQEESKDQLTPEEIELRNQLEPGNYFVTKANGQRIKFLVTAKHTDGGTLEQLEVWFPCKNEHKTDHMHNTAYLRQVLGEPVASIEDMLAENARMRKQLADLQVTT